MEARTSYTQKKVVSIYQKDRLIATGMGDCVICPPDFIGDKEDSWLESIEIGEVFTPQLQALVGQSITTKALKELLGR